MGCCATTKKKEQRDNHLAMFQIAEKINKQENKMEVIKEGRLQQKKQAIDNQENKQKQFVKLKIQDKQSQNFEVINQQIVSIKKLCKKQSPLLSNKQLYINKQNGNKSSQNQKEIDSKFIKIQKTSKIISNPQNFNSQYQLFKQPIIDSQPIRNITEQDIFCVNDLPQIQKKLFVPPVYLWIDQYIHDISNNIIKLLKQKDIDPILCKTVEEAKAILQIYQNENSDFRIITSAKLGQEVCKQFQNNTKVTHIYIFCAYQPAAKALKNKWKKIKFYTVDISDFLMKIEQLSNYDNKYAKLANFMEITNKDNTYDNTIINKSRYNLYGLLLFKNRLQAKNDFIKLVNHIHSSNNNTINKQIKKFQDQYPVVYNHPKALNWYTKPTFFYGLLNNFLRSSNNPLETPYIRLPFQATFKAIKSIYDQGKQQKSLCVYRGGNIDQNQLEYLQKNVGQYIQMFGFMSTSLKEDVANVFIVNSLIEVVIQNQDRERKIDYGYVNLSKYSEIQDEEQILFNALNVYKIMSFKKQGGIYKIKLKYGQLARMVKLGQERVGQKEKKIILNHRHQQEIINDNLIDQGNVFRQCQMYQKEIEFRKIKQRKNQQNQNVKKANQFSYLGQVMHQKGNHNQALQYYQRALKIYINVSGQNYNNTASALSNIGSVYRSKDEYNKALQYYQRALKIYINVLGQSHSSTTGTINNIGLVYESKGDYNKALQYYQRALKIKIHVSGQSHSSTAGTLNNIGQVYRSKGDYNNALQYYERALKIYINILGQSHSSTAGTINNIAQVYRIRGYYEKSLQYYQRALKIKINVLGQSHSSTAGTLNNIGQVYRSKGDYNKALKYYQRALKIKIHVLGQSHSSTAGTLNNIGEVYRSKGDYNKALKYYQRALQIKIHVLGQIHSSTAGTLNNIGLIYHQRIGEQNKALQYYQRALQIKIHVLGQSHSSTANTLNNIGQVYRSKGDYNKALQYYQRALKIYINIFGQNHNSTAGTISNMAQVYRSKGNYNKVLECSQRVLKIKINVLGQIHSSTASTIRNIGLLYLSRKLFSQAIPYLIRCYQIQLKVFGQQHKSTQQTLMIINSCLNS